MRKERGEPGESFVKESKGKDCQKVDGQMSRIAESSSRNRIIVSNDEKSADLLGRVVSGEDLPYYLGVLEEWLLRG